MTIQNVFALVFADTPELEAAGRKAATDPRLSRSRIEVQRGGIAAAAAWLAENPSPDVLVLGDEADETVWARLEALADHVESTCRVVVAGRCDSIAVYREMVGYGLADYLGGTIEARELADCICRLFAAEEGLPKGKLVTVMGASGGAGTSTAAVIIAHGLAGRYGDAVLLDLDLPMGTAGLLSGTDVRDALAAALGNPGVDANMLERFMVRDGAVRLLSTPGSLRENRALDGEGAEKIANIARSMAKVVVVDLPKGWGDAYERLAAQADEVVLVAAPDLASLRNCRMIVEDVASRRIDGRKPKLVLNRVGMSKRSEYGAADFAEAGGGAPSVMVPWEPEPLMATIADGRPLALSAGKAVAALRGFADTLLVQEGGKSAAKRKKAGPSLIAGLRARLNALAPSKGKV